MADLSRFFPGLGLGAAAPNAAPPLAQPAEQGEGAQATLPEQINLTSGLLNPMALLSPSAAASGARNSTPTRITPTSSSSANADQAVLLEMLQTAAPPPAKSAAISSTPAKSAKAPKGVTLDRGEAVYDIAAAAASGRKQTKVTAITIYNTDPGYRAGRLIAVSPRYICYGVRGGSVRVIHQTTGQRLLQKGHTSVELTDLCIHGDGDECRLAAVVANGDLFVWTICIENMTEVKATELLRRQGGTHGFVRILWHPAEALLAATATSGESASVSIWKGFADTGGVTEPVCTVMDAAHRGAISGLAWMGGGGSADCMAVASASADGKVVLCNTASGAVQSCFEPFGGEAVQSVLVAHPKGLQSPIIITGSAGNACIKMWDAAGRTCLHCLTFAAGASRRAGADIFLATIDMDPLSDFLFVANTVASGGGGDSFAVYSLHINCEGDAPHFACLCEFGVVHPVLSFTVCRDSSPEAESEVRQREMHLYCMQTKAIQQYHLRPDQCCDAASEPSCAPLVTIPEPQLPLPLPVSQNPQMPELIGHASTSSASGITAASPTPQPDEVEALLRQAMSAVPAESVEQLLAPSPASALTHPPPPPQSSSSAAGARTPAAVGDALPRSAGVAEQCVEGVGVAEVALPSPMLGAAGVEALLARMQQSQQEVAEALYARMQAANEDVLARLDAENNLQKKRRQQDKEEMKKQMEALVTKLSVQMEERLTKALSAAVAKEVQKELGSGIKTHLPLALDAHTRSPQHAEATKNAFTAAVAPAMEKAVKSSAKEVVAGIKPSVQEAFKTSFQASIIPAFESSCQTMFAQIHATFERGQLERMHADAAHTRALSKFEALETLAGSLTSKLHLLESRASATLAQPAAGTTAAHVAAAQAAPAQPEETVEQLAARLTQLVNEEKYDEVFSQVLSRSDLKLVTWLCKKTDPRKVFAGKFLSAPVILSLVQQLGFDLKTESQIKIQWLRDAVASLDQRDPLVGSHVPVILRDLQLKLLAMERNPTESPITQDNDFRILMHVLRSVIS